VDSGRAAERGASTVLTVTPRTLRRILLPLAVALPLTLAACVPLPFPIGAGGGGGSRPVPTVEVPSPSDGLSGGAEDPAVGAPPSSLTFADGADVTGDWIAQWADGMAMGADYELASPDDGNGNWSYTYVPGGCTVRFWQGSVANLGVFPDDSSLSDRVLATYINESDSVVASNAVDDEVPFGFDGSGAMDVRAITANNDTSGATFYVAARGITGLDAGLVLAVECPQGADATDVERTIAGQGDLAAVLTPR
jgi:hypothetical protein